MSSRRHRFGIGFEGFSSSQNEFFCLGGPNGFGMVLKDGFLYDGFDEL